MPRRLFPVGAILSVLVLASMSAMLAMPQAAPAQASAALVPVNVHVVDRSGKPITDLKQEDFTVTEDGVPQSIRHFVLQALAPDPSAPGAPVALRKGITSSPQNRRLIVIALGMGKLEVPSGYISALLRFVKTRLLPQDAVALFVHARAIPFTTDHQKIADALERFRKAHEGVNFELGLELGTTGMAPLYGTRVLPKKLQAKIDTMVFGPGAAPATPTSADVIDHDALAVMSFDDFCASNAITLQDQDNLMVLMEYLRRVEGDKDVLFVTEKGFIWSSNENDRALASLANDARASIHSLQAGGMLAAEANKEIEATAQQADSFRSLRNIADLTGGLAAITGNGQATIDRLDETTRTGYLLGFQSSRAAWDGTYRNITVKVNRPDATVLYRHGYYRTEEVGSFDRRSFVTNSRLGAAANFRREVDDIKVKASASQHGGATLTVEGKIDLSKVKVATLGDLRVGLLTAGVFCFDSSGNPTGAHVDALPLQLSEADYANARKNGFPYTIQFPSMRGTQNIRFVVYDFGSDLIGRVDTKVF